MHSAMWLLQLCPSVRPYVCPYVCPSYSGLSVCLSVAYIGPTSRTDRHRKTKIGTEVAHDTGDSDTTFKVKRSKVKVTRPLYSPPCWRIRHLQRWAWERVGREKMLLCCRLLGRARRFSSHGGRRGAGHIVAAARLQLDSLTKEMTAVNLRAALWARTINLSVLELHKDAVPAVVYRKHTSSSTTTPTTVRLLSFSQKFLLSN